MEQKGIFFPKHFAATTRTDGKGGKTITRVEEKGIIFKKKSIRTDKESGFSPTGKKSFMLKVTEIAFSCHAVTGMTRTKSC